MLKAKDIMTKNVITVEPETPIKELAALLTRHRINGVPVVDKKKKLIGIVTEADLVDQNKQLHLPTIVTLLDGFFFLESPDKIKKQLKKMAGTKVADIYTEKVVTVEEDDPLDKIATIMADKRINTLPVLKDGDLVGIIGRGDVVRTLTGQPKSQK